MISHNKAVNGGGVYLDDESAFTTSMEGTNNSSSDGYTRGELRIEYNEAEECGGGIYGGIEYEAVDAWTLYSVKISHNTATCGGGMYVGTGASSEPNSRYEISENAAKYGGGVYAEGYCKMHCNVLGNEATLDGGGIYVKDATFEVDGSSSRSVDSNKAGRNGGGVYLEGDSYFDAVSGSNFEITNNEAVECGGGIYMQSGSVSFAYPTLVEGNTAGECGGGLYIEDGYISSEKSSSVYSERAAMEIFENSAKLGGGVYMAGGEMDLSSADISGNTATGEGAEEGLGGGIYMAGGTLIMYDGSVSRNNAASGGGIYASDGSLTILGGTISGNSATNGGGAYIAEGTVTMTGGEITGNGAEQKGGGVYMGVGTFNVQGSPVISENSTDSEIDENLYLTGKDFITVTGVLSEDALLCVAVDYEPSDYSVPMMAVWSENAYSEGILEHFVSENGYILHRNEAEMCIELVLIHTVDAEMEYGGANLEITLKDTHDNEMYIKSGYTTVFYDENNEVIDASDILTMTPGGTYYISVHVEASEDYTAFDSELHSLTVTEKDISNAEIVLGEELVYNFEEQEQKIASVTIDGLEVEYEIVEGTNVGKDSVETDEDKNYLTDSDGNYITKVYTLVIEGTGYFTGTASTTFTISRLALGDSGQWALVREYEYVYDGDEHILGVTSLSYGEHVLAEGIDYVVSYTAKTDVCSWVNGSIDGLGNFCGSISNYSYRIVARDISEDSEYVSSVSIEYGGVDEAYLTSFVYNGEEQGPAIVGITIYADDLKEEGLYLTEGTDFTVSGYMVNAGTYDLTITGNGNYTGSITVSFTINPLDISDSEVEVELENYLVYDGSEKTQNVSSVCVDGLYIRAEDYEVSDNVQTEAGTYSLTITGVNNCTGEIKVSFTIYAQTIESAVVTFVDESLTYNGQVQHPEIKSITVNGVEIPESDYEVEYVDSVNVGEYTLIINITGSYEGVLSAEYQIVALDISGVYASEISVVLGDELTYNGSSQTQLVESVTVSGLELTYTVSGNEQTDAGTYTLTITGTGNFTGTIAATFEIKAKSIEGADVSLDTSQFTYNGERQTPAISSVSIDGLAVIYDTGEGECSGEFGVDAGTYTLVISGKDNFTGEIEVTFTIDPLDIDGATVELDGALTYDRTVLTHNFGSVAVGSLTLTDEDYAVSGNTGTNAGSYTMTITGQGNYTGTRKVDFTIEALSIEGAEIDLSQDDLPYNASAQRPDVISVTVNGVELETSEYSVNNTSHINAGTYSVTVTARGGNFTGSATATYTISPLSLDGADVYAQDLTYNGEVRDVSIVWIRVGNISLGSSDYTITYDGEIKDTGTYNFTVTAASGNFEGAITSSFMVNPREISYAEIVLGESLTYNGQEQMQDISVIYNGVEVGYKVLDDSDKGTSSGTYTLYIEADDSNFTGTAHTSFTIEKLDISAENVRVVVTLDSYELTYTGEAQHPAISSADVYIIVDGTEDEGHKLSYIGHYDSNAIDAGTYKITVSADGVVGHTDFTGSVEVEYTIVSRAIDEIEYIFEFEEYVYNGSAQSPVVATVYGVWYEEVEDSGAESGYITLKHRFELDPATYEVSMPGNAVNAGTYAFTITILGGGNYSAAAPFACEFTIERYDISSATVYIAGHDSFVYNGETQTLVIESVTVDLNGVETEIEFNVTGNSTRYVGTHIVTITPVDEENFTGHITRSFTISRMDISEVEIAYSGDSFTYDGEMQGPEIYSFGGVAVSSSDYILSGDLEALHPGEYTLVIEGIGNFTGTAEIVWIIEKAIPEYTEPTGLTAERGDKLGEVELPEGWTWDAYEDYQFDVSGASYYFWATFTPDDTEDYETVRLRLKVFVSSEEANDYGASLSIVEYPAQMEYTAFDAFDPDGIILSIELEDGTSVEVAGSEFEHEITNGDSLTRDENGQCEIIITYYIPIEYLDSISGGSGISTLAYADNPEAYIALSVVFHVTVNKLTPSVHIETSDLAEGSSGDGSYSFADILTMSDGEVTYKFYTLVDGEYVEYEGDIYEAPTGTYYIKVFISETNNCEAAESDYYEFKIVEAPEPEEESDSVRTASIIATVVAGAVIVISLIVLIVYLTRKRKY